ncbi:MAG: tRNA threonylcarbamoyladenosine dehydratase [Gammaproteobacteria bacterium]|nr:MAG: tRNA threonylcarbamoyladenosine dehydratase [Gammaproteobacteria bacterium]
MNNFLERTHILVGDEGLSKLKQANVMIAGLGGVGSYVVEALARSGIGKLTIIDNDVISQSNINRQLPALNSTVGKPKTTIIEHRVRDINPECKLTVINDFLRTENLPQYLQAKSYDYVADCIDSLNSKVSLIETAYNLGLNIISSMGAGGKLDPTRIEVTDLFKTHECPLAKMMRSRLRRRGIKKGIKAVFSSEIPQDPLPPEPTDSGRPRSVVGSISFIPPIFGLMMAGVIVNDILKD